MDSLTSIKSQSWLSWFLRGTLILFFLILFAKLFEIQIIKGGYFRDLSEENRIRHVPIPAPRGKILARGGEVLAGNIEIKKRIKFLPQGGFEITDDLTGASPEDTIIDYKRVYPGDSMLAHAVGYLAYVGEGEVGKIDPACPEKGPRISGALIGRTGLEGSYDCQLAGVSGEELIEVSTSGKKIRTLGRKNPIPGQDIKTTIDYGLQLEVSADLEGKKGAAVVTDLAGQVLAFYSSPSFNPNLFIGGGNNQKIVDLLKSLDLPFFDRVISGTFHPGSVFKPLVAIAALQEGSIDKNFVFTDPGVITVSGFSYTNWYFTEYGRTEGTISLVRAIARSADTFFYKIGEMVGPEAIAKWAEKFGLNKKTGIDIAGEVEGLIPTPEWKEETKKEAWFLGNTYHMSIGQGDVSLTPLEVNTYISTIANGGVLCRPGFLITQSPVCSNLEIKKGNLDLVKEGMKEACSSGGTAYTFFDFAQKHAGVEVACKTGTAEVETDGTPHAWFTLFAPADDPRVVATVLIEKGGEGSSVAGPIARKIMDYYFND
jgi:penicillin-binding protein 2